jgi:hypothetical protein
MLLTRTMVISKRNSKKPIPMQAPIRAALAFSSPLREYEKNSTNHNGHTNSESKPTPHMPQSIVSSHETRGAAEALLAGFVGSFCHIPESENASPETAATSGKRTPRVRISNGKNPGAS